MHSFEIRSHVTSFRLSRFDMVSKNILPLFPTSTLPGLTRNFVSQAADVKSANQMGSKTRSLFHEQSQSLWIACLVHVGHTR